MRVYVDDWDILEEERENLVRLESRVKELAEQAGRAQHARQAAAEQQQQQAAAAPAAPAADGAAAPAQPVAMDVDGGAAVAPMVPAAPEAPPQQQAQQALATSGSLWLGGEQGEDVVRRAEETAEAVGKLKVILEGPPTFPPLLSGKHAQVRGERDGCVVQSMHHNSCICIRHPHLHLHAPRGGAPRAPQ